MSETTFLRDNAAPQCFKKLIFYPLMSRAFISHILQKPVQLKFPSPTLLPPLFWSRLLTHGPHTSPLTATRPFTQPPHLSHPKSSIMTSSNPVLQSGNLAVITGGASGIGLALAEKCVGYGMKVIIADNNAENLKAAKKRSTGLEIVEMDVARIEEWGKLKVCFQPCLKPRIILVCGFECH